MCREYRLLLYDSQSLISDMESSILSGVNGVGDGIVQSNIRGEVEALIRLVVPQEVDHIDEMMIQFHGREEELLEQLKIMYYATLH